MPETEMPDVGKRIRTLRERQGLSLRALSRRSGLSLNAISLIERGNNSPTVSSLHLLANALHVPIIDFFQDGAQHGIIFLQPDDRLRTAAGGITLESLGTGLRNQQSEPFLVTVVPGAGDLDQPITHGGEEFVFCLEGMITYEVAGREYTLAQGCSLLFNATLAHAFSNHGDVPAVLLMVFHTTDGGHLARRLHMDTDEGR